MRTKRQRDFLSMAISGTMETPMPALTMLRRLLNWPLSKIICGCKRARSHAARIAEAVAIAQQQKGLGAQVFQREGAARG